MVTKSTDDDLFSSVVMEMRGHDMAVLESYMRFLRAACVQLNVTVGRVEQLPTVKWMQTVVKSRFVHGKHKVQYETRTHVRKVEVLRVTGSTASTLLEYVQRNLPEGVAMKVTYYEVLALPEHLASLIN